jgi:Phage-related minor tail protein
MSDQLKIQGVVEMSAEGAENALDRVGEKAGQMADRLQREGAKAGSAVDSIGAGADKSAEQFSRAEGKMAASIKRATTNLEQLGKTASEKLQFQINQKGLDASKFEPMLAKLREVESANVRVGMSAAQTAAALRNVPAQFTDIAVSLASGQKPMTVLLQQGGQLKDMFGGVGAAAKAVGGYVASLVNPVTIAAAAVGGLGYAFYAARAEADEFRKNLILTGNISGLTTDKFNAMAQSMANVSGITRGAAAEALTAMAASGSIGADSIERLTKSALQFEKAGGPAVAETVKQFEALGKEPVKASVELSEKPTI